jgi:hypothetical protein
LLNCTEPRTLWYRNSDEYEAIKKGYVGDAGNKSVLPTLFPPVLVFANLGLPFADANANIFRQHVH